MNNKKKMGKVHGFPIIVPAAAAKRFPLIKNVPRKQIIICRPNKGVTETAAPQARPIEIDSGRSFILYTLYLYSFKNLKIFNFLINNTFHQKN